MRLVTQQKRIDNPAWQGGECSDRTCFKQHYGRPEGNPMASALAAVFAVAVVVASVATVAQAAPKPMSKDAAVYIIWPPDGAVISGGKFWVRMGLKGAGVAPATVDVPNTGHHHLLIDTDLPPFDQPIPNDKSHLHFGRGQTEARLELPPGRHTLQLLFGDGQHIPTDPPLYSKKITIIVPPSVNQ